MWAAAKGARQKRAAAKKWGERQKGKITRQNQTKHSQKRQEKAKK